MEKCIISGKLLPDDKLVLTECGFVATFLWGRREVKMNNAGLALFPVDLAAKYYTIFGHNPDPDMLE